jgi:CHAT domain-containing protein
LHFLSFESLTRSPERGVVNRRVRYGECADVDWLLNHFTISCAVSATSLDPELAPQTPIPETLVAFAEPLSQKVEVLGKKVELRGSLGPFATLIALAPLPLTSEEVNHVALAMKERVQITTLTGPDANEGAFFDRAPQAGYVHFAVHSLVDDQMPEYSTLVLSPDERSDGFLQTFEILKSRLNSRLVTLSGCETALGRLYKGEGLLGLSHPFFWAPFTLNVTSGP